MSQNYLEKLALVVLTALACPLCLPAIIPLVVDEEVEPYEPRDKS